MSEGQKLELHIPSHLRLGIYIPSQGHCRDEWATTVVRAARVVAAGIGCTLYVDWERRCSSRESIIADNLTHNLLEGLDEKELESYLASGNVSFAEPILHWMARPRKDLGLGSRIIIWLRKQFVGINMLKCS